MSMLDKVCNHVHNYFVSSVHDGTFTLSGGVAIDLPTTLKDGQYIRVVGSVFNDGIHLLPVSNFTDEVFEGTIYGLAIPKAFLDLVSEIEAWCVKAANAPSVYTSESFDGYSYSRATDKGGAPITWKTAFRKDLNEYRCLK